MLIIADTSVNVDDEQYIGTCILPSMEGKSVMDFKFTKLSCLSLIEICASVQDG